MQLCGGVKWIQWLGGRPLVAPVVEWDRNMARWVPILGEGGQKPEDPWVIEGDVDRRPALVHVRKGVQPGLRPYCARGRRKRGHRRSKERPKNTSETKAVRSKP